MNLYQKAFMKTAQECVRNWVVREAQERMAPSVMAVACPHGRHEYLGNRKHHGMCKGGSKQAVCFGQRWILWKLHFVRVFHTQSEVAHWRVLQFGDL